MFVGLIVFVRYIVAWFNTLFWSSLGCALIFVVGPSVAWIVVHRAWAYTTLWLLGVRLDVCGTEHLNQPAVYISNHQSLIDVVALPAILPSKVRFIAKRELLLIPFWGWILGFGGAVLINRKESRSAIESIRQGLVRLPTGWSVVVFPEGTRSRDGEVKKFKSGAFHVAALTDLPVVPIGIDGAREVAPLNRWLVRGGTVRINIGSAISTEHWARGSIKDYAAEGQAAVEACVRQARRRGVSEAAAHTHEESVAFIGEGEGSV